VQLDATHHDAGEVSTDEPGTTQIHADELRSPQVVGSGEGCHGSSSSSGLGEADGSPPLLPPSRRTDPEADTGHHHAWELTEPVVRVSAAIDPEIRGIRICRRPFDTFGSRAQGLGTLGRSR
jgi:hypothetical protein